MAAYNDIGGESCSDPKQAERELRASECQKTLILDNAAEIIAFHDTNHIIQWANRAYLKAGGLSLSGLNGKKCYQAWGLDRLCNGCPVALAITTGKPHTAELTPQNQPHWPLSQGSWRVSAAPVRDDAGRIVGAIEISFDITERRRAEDNEQLAREVLEQVTNAEALPDMAHNVLRVIKERTGVDAVGIRLREGEDFPYLAASGFSEDFLRTERYLCVRSSSGRIICDETGKPVLECMCGNVIRGRTSATQQFFTEGGSFWTNSTTRLLASTTETERRTRTRNRCNADGYESVALIPLRFGGEILGLLQINDRRPDRFTLELIRFLENLGVSLGMAISRKKAEEDTRKANAELQSALQQLRDTQSLVVRQERLGALGQMASGIAHDFNNALVPILGYTDLLLSVPGILDNRAELTKMLELVRSGAVTAAETVRRLKDFYRAPDETRHGPVNLPEVIRTTVALTRPRWKEEMEAKGVAIAVHTEVAAMPPVLGEAHELRRLLTNLIFNSVDAMPRGGRISIRLRPHASGRQAVLEVQDTGAGMSEEVRLKCMDPFFTTKSGRGVGLGLSVSHGIVQRHKGSMDVQSAPGQGTIVTVRLPLVESPGGSARSPGTMEGANADRACKGTPDSLVRPLRVLFVDDEESARRLIRRYLESDGHTVELASDGSAGLASFKAGRFDVVILDRAMPGMSGDELAAAIKEQSARTPVVILTGFDDAAGRCQVADMVIRKPLTRDVLRRAMAEVMSPARGSGLHAG